jgi:iron complex transport system ATP-binding protein
MACHEEKREVPYLRLAVENIYQRYGSNEVLDGLNFSVDSGEMVALLGPNGSGKSTLIKTICDLFPPKSGRVTVDGRGISDIDPLERAKIIGYVPQTVQHSPFTSVLDTVLVGRRPYVQWSYSKKDLEMASAALETMNILDLRSKYINELSGGQRQRVFIARTLTQHPQFYLFDEPTSSLDLKYQLKTMRIMREVIHKEGCGMIVAMHDLNLALRYADKVLMLKDKHIYSYGKTEDVLTIKAIHDVYGVESNIVKNDHGLFILPYDSFDDVIANVE